MTDSHHTRLQIDTYLDGEMPDAERNRFLAHGRECEHCRARVESRRHLLHAIRAARPEVHASPDLRRSITAALNRQASAPVEPSRPSRWKRFLSPAAWLPAFHLRPSYAWLLLILLAVGLALHLSQQQARANQLLDAAIDTHRRGLAGAAPIEFQSASAREVTRWCNSKLPFVLRLPTYQDDSGDRSQYQLLGASRVPFRGKNAAYIAYQMGKERLTLIVVPIDQAIASGGEVTKAKSLVFHSVRRNGLEAITWSVHNLTYALVSGVNLPPKQSCVVCHANPKDRQWLQSAVVHRTPSPQGRNRLLGTNAITMTQMSDSHR